MDGNARFNTVVARFEQYISGFSFVRYELGERELVYDIENSIVIHVSVRSENYNRIVLEVIFNEGIYDLKLKKFEDQPEGSIVQVFQYSGGLGISNPYMQSRYERVKALLPELNLDKRFEQWQGFSIPHLLFELTEDSRTGYAICSSHARQTMKKVIAASGDLLYACLNAEKYFSSGSGDGDFTNCSGISHNFTMSKTMADIVLDRLRGKSEIWNRSKKPPYHIRIVEPGLRFCWINARVKHPCEHFDGKVIRDIQCGYYDDVDRYDFILPDNKWKSEQLVYELVKQLYPKEGVWYQYRPDFLFSGRGQLSYDIYISKLRVAIEYQGKQHFEPVEIFGGAESFEKQKHRDEMKARLSAEHGVKLIYINYWEPISADLIKSKVDEAIKTT